MLTAALDAKDEQNRETAVTTAQELIMFLNFM
jgi:hypothetical protein